MRYGQRLGPVERGAASAQIGFTNTLDVLAAGAVPGGDTAGDVTEERFAEVVRGDVSPGGQALGSLTQNPVGIVGTGIGAGGLAGRGVGFASRFGSTAELAARGAVGAAGIGITAIEANRIREQIESGEFEEAAETAARFGLGTAGFVGGFGRASPSAAESSLVSSETTGTVGRIETQFRPGDTAELTGGLRGGRLLSQVETARQTVPRAVADRVPGVDVGPRTSTRFIETRLQSDTLKAGGGEVVGRVSGERFDVPRVLEPESGRLRPRPEFGESRGTGADVFEASTSDADVAGVPRDGLRFTSELPSELVGSAAVSGGRSVGRAETPLRVETPQGRAGQQNVLGVTEEGAPFRVASRTEVFRTDEVASARDVSGDQRLDLEAADRDIVNVRDLVETAESIFGETTAEAGRAETVETTIGTVSETEPEDDPVSGDGDTDATVSRIDTDRPGVTVDAGGPLSFTGSAEQDFAALPGVGTGETGRTNTGVDVGTDTAADTAVAADTRPDTDVDLGIDRGNRGLPRTRPGRDVSARGGRGARSGFSIAFEQAQVQRQTLEQRPVRTPIQRVPTTQIPTTVVPPGFALPAFGGDGGQVDRESRGIGVGFAGGEDAVPDILSASAVELGGEEAAFPEEGRGVDFGPIAALQPVDDAEDDGAVAGIDVEEVEFL